MRDEVFFLLVGMVAMFTVGFIFGAVVEDRFDLVPIEVIEGESE